MDIVKLHENIADVCPITGVSVGKANDKTTWKFELKPEATADQINAAKAVIAAFDETVVPAQLPTLSELEARIAALEAKVG